MDGWWRERCGIEKNVTGYGVMDSLITIIAGSRDNVTQDDIDQAMTKIDWKVSKVISGTARGADQFGENWALRQGIPVDRYPADWDKHGKSAGYKRNEKMATMAEALVAVWDGESRGTTHMINIAVERGLKVHVHNVKKGVTMSMEIQEQIFKEWMRLKTDVQYLAEIIQNDNVVLTEQDVLNWVSKVDNFKQKVNLLSEATFKFIKPLVGN